MRRFLQWWQKSEDNELFDGAYMFLDEEQRVLYRGSSCYLDVPFCDSGLRVIHSAGIPQLARHALWQGYQKLQKIGFVKFAASLGVHSRLEVTLTRIPRDHPHYHYLLSDWFHFRVRRTDTSINQDYDIPCASELLLTENAEISRRIWMTMMEAQATVLQATYRPNQQYSLRTAPSSIVCRLRETPWIPDRFGRFRLPREMTRDLLPSEFPFKDTSGWLSEIGFGEDERQQSDHYKKREEMAKELALPMALLDRLDELDESGRQSALEKFSVLLESQIEPEFPEHTSLNPERRANRLRDRLKDSPVKTRELRNRTIRTSEGVNRPEARAYLRDLYTNADGVMICQACHKAMPFRLENGDYYFEAVDFFADAQHEYRENCLAMCPTCAAMFKYASDFDPQQFRESLLDATDLRIPIELAGTSSQIRFVADHRTDLLTLAEIEYEFTVEK